MRLENGYETCTTFWQDFSLADPFGVKAIQDTFNNAFKSWQSDYKFMTELACVMSWKAFHWYDKNNFEYSDLYSELYHKVDNWCCDNLKGDEFKYYLRWTD